MIKNVKINHLLSLIVQLTSQGCHIVQNCFTNKNVKHFMKAVDDPVTEADFKIQTMLIRGLRMHYPTIKIIGEEQTEYQGQIQCDYSQFKFPFLPLNSIPDVEIPQSDLCIWIDPIDSTKGFINGTIQDVTVLIGISLNQKAQMGVIGIPYKKVGNQAIYDPSIVVGSSSQKMAFEYFPVKGEWNKLSTPTPKQAIRIVTSPHRSSNLDQKVVKQVKGQWLRIGGSGRKIMMVVKEEAEVALYAFSSTYKWDSCAGEAIIYSLNGYFTSQYGDQILYDPNKSQESNKEGFVCTFDQNLHQKIIQTCLDERKQAKQ